MKQFLLFLISIFTMSILLSCSPSKTNTKLIEEDTTLHEKEIDYKIEQIIFSKSFQSTEPNVEIISKKNNLKILASLGLAEYSDIKINSVVKKGNVVNIHVSGISGENSSLAVPQVIMELDELKLNSVENLKFNIAFDDYTPLKIKLGINDIINKVQSHFKIVSNRLPIYNLIKEDNHVIWDISYKGIFDRENPILPLINLSTLIDANTGEILESEKTIISSTLDNGQILDFKPDSHILYKKSKIKDNETKQSKDQLWYLDTLNNEKTILYSSDYKILSALFNFDKSYISLIENNGDINNLYIISFQDKRAFKISFETNFHPKIMRWKDNDILYIVENNGTISTIYSYDVENNEKTLISRVDKSIDNLAIKNNYYLISEKVEDQINKNIYMSTDGITFKFIDNGFDMKFLTDNVITYLKKNEKNDLNSLYIYDLKNQTIVDIIEENITNYSLIGNDKLIYIKQNTNNNDYSIVKYSFNEKTKEDITTILGDKIYYNENNNKIYLNIILPFENNKTEMIYSIDLDKLNNN